MDNFPTAPAQARPAVAPLPAPPDDPASWNGATPIDPSGPAVSPAFVPGVSAGSIEASQPTTAGAPVRAMAGRLMPVGKLFPGLTKPSAPAVRPRPPLTDPAAFATLARPEARLKQIRAHKNVKASALPIDPSASIETMELASLGKDHGSAVTLVLSVKSGNDAWRRIAVFGRLGASVTGFVPLDPSLFVAPVRLRVELRSMPLRRAP